MQDSDESFDHRPKKYSLKETLRRVRRDLAKSLRMDRSADAPLDAVSSQNIIASPFQPYGQFDYESETEAPSLYLNSNSPPYHPSTPDFDHHSDISMSDHQQQLDGTGGMFSRRAKTSAPPVAAIFVHAGAGYHSTTNEQYHLAACSDACKMAMKIMKAGGTSVDAVEAAIRVLEDREITNSGYGSNLSIIGRVEGDATVVDHMGRSGACGATPQIKNPVGLARMILELSNRPLSLRRVPPNLLVGQGATEFAREHGIAIVPHEAIISRNALDRYTRWKEDLRRAELQRPTTPNYSHINLDEDDGGNSRRDHTNALLTATWNEGQPDSPAPASPAPRNSSNYYPNLSPNPEDFGTPYSNPNTPPHVPSPQHMPAPPSRATMRSPVSSSINYGESPAKRQRRNNRSSEGLPRTSSPLGMQTEFMSSRHEPMNASDGADSPVRQDPGVPLKVDFLNLDGERGDHITDTVGAIAIDVYGNIAAASSSGGIGMKHSGRVGPAALVGIGSAVIPVDDQDPDGVTVAAVTSGTGEHMATTMASQKCCERLYNNTRKGPGPRSTDVECSEEDAIESFVTWDFMEHPGVRSSHSAGAIGVMAVKKMPGGYYLHFAHNTDSFALASMHSNENSAKCVMSRLGDRCKVVQGGRKVRAD